MVVKTEQFTRCPGWAYRLLANQVLELSKTVLYGGSILKDFLKAG